MAWRSYISDMYQQKKNITACEMRFRIFFILRKINLFIYIEYANKEVVEHVHFSIFQRICAR